MTQRVIKQTFVGCTHFTPRVGAAGRYITPAASLTLYWLYISGSWYFFPIYLIKIAKALSDWMEINLYSMFWMLVNSDFQVLPPIIKWIDVWFLPVCLGSCSCGEIFGTFATALRILQSGTGFLLRVPSIWHRPSCLWPVSQSKRLLKRIPTTIMLQ